MNHVIAILKLLAIGLLGYLVIALSQTLALEVLLGGRLAADAPPAIVIPATLGTIMSGLIGGYLVAGMGRPRPWQHVSIVIGFLTIDTISVLARHDGTNPLWFEMGGALTLMLATAGGGWLRGGPFRTLSVHRP